MDESPLLNARDLGKKLGVGGKTVAIWAKAGKIPAEIREGRLYRFDLEKVRSALAERAKKGVTSE